MMVVSRSYHAAGREKESLDVMEEALRRAEAENDKFLQAEIESIYGQYYYDQKRYKDSEAHFMKAIDLSKEGHFDECLLIAYKGASDASRRFDPAKALEYYEQSVALKDSIFNENQQTLIRDYQVKYDLAEKEHQLEIQQKNNRTQALEIIILFVFAGLLVVIMVILMRLIRVRKK